MVPLSGTTLSEVIQIPDELLSWANGPFLHKVLLKVCQYFPQYSWTFSIRYNILQVKEQSGAHRITPQHNDDGYIIVLIDSATREKAVIARQLLDIHFKQQMKLSRAEKMYEQTQRTLSEVQGEMASGTRLEFNVPVDLLGLIIGKKGVRVQQIQRETNVTTINIDGETGTSIGQWKRLVKAIFLPIGKICIVGPDNASSQRAKELLDLVETSVDVDADAADWLQRDPSNLGVEFKIRCIKFLLLG